MKSAHCASGTPPRSHRRCAAEVLTNLREGDDLFESVEVLGDFVGANDPQEKTIRAYSSDDLVSDCFDRGSCHI